MNMESAKDISEAFRQVRIAGERQFKHDKITWEGYTAVMIGFEEMLKSMGQVI